nr:cyclin-dependent kinase inhibitor 7-like isoform X2 [Ipomoea batatas]GME21429.1 cyclin-dependent kinase inhibitor 7-like isoform X2 [Ipomoea batatas]
MEEYLRCRRCEPVGETTTAAATEAGVGNGAAVRMKAREVTSFSSNKRRKVYSQFDDRKMNWSSENSVFPATSVTSRCSSCESSDVAKNILDLKGEVFETDDTAHCNGRLSRETTPTTELRRDSVTEMESSSTTKNVSMAATSPQKPSTMEMPSAEEIEEFFSAAEKYEQERFKQKYNYDVVKDVPLEGRYEWVPLKPCSHVIKACEEEHDMIAAFNN